MRQLNRIRKSKSFGYLPVFFALAVWGVLMVGSLTRGVSGGNTVKLTKSGFVPQELRIKKGETVTFVTDQEAFWPASNPHPIHTGYSKFDPRKIIKKGETWSFTFEKPGVWRFHDHLRPFLTGKVVVLDEDGNIVQQDCKGEGKVHCWEEALASSLEEKGTKEAFALFTKFYKEDPEFAQTGCHWFSHKIGETAYAEYLTHQDFEKVDFPPETAYCGYGFYHGFFEHLLRDYPDLEMGKNLCETLTRRLSNVIPRIRLNCYHAMGHGFVKEPADVTIWGYPQEMIKPAIEVCDAFSEQDLKRECLQGAFNVITDWIWTEQFGLKPNDDDPMELCRIQEEREHELACYYELAMRLNPYTNEDVVEIYDRFVSEIGDDYIASLIITSVMAGKMQREVVKEDHTHLVLECRRLPKRVYQACLIGLTGGFVAHGEPGREYEKALNLCSAEVLTEEEKSICYGNTFRTFRGAYPQEKVEELCSQVNKEYRQYCEQN